MTRYIDFDFSNEKRFNDIKRNKVFKQKGVSDSYSVVSLKCAICYLLNLASVLSSVYLCKVPSFYLSVVFVCSVFSIINRLVIFMDYEDNYSDSEASSETQSLRGKYVPSDNCTVMLCIVSTCSTSTEVESVPGTSTPD